MIFLPPFFFMPIFFLNPQNSENRTIEKSEVLISGNQEFGKSEREKRKVGKLKIRKIGNSESWKIGKSENWKIGKSENWKVGKLANRKIGKAENWKFGKSGYPENRKVRKSEIRKI